MGRTSIPATSNRSCRGLLCEEFDDRLNALRRGLESLQSDCMDASSVFLRRGGKGLLSSGEGAKDLVSVLASMCIGSISFCLPLFSYDGDRRGEELDLRSLRFVLSRRGR